MYNSIKYCVRYFTGQSYETQTILIRKLSGRPTLWRLIKHHKTVRFEPIAPQEQISLVLSTEQDPEQFHRRGSMSIQQRHAPVFQHVPQYWSRFPPCWLVGAVGGTKIISSGWVRFLADLLALWGKPLLAGGDGSASTSLGAGTAEPRHVIWQLLLWSLV